MVWAASRLSIKMSSYPSRNLYYQDRCSHNCLFFIMGMPRCTGEDGLYIKTRSWMATGLEITHCQTAQGKLNSEAVD